MALLQLPFTLTDFSLSSSTAESPLNLIHTPPKVTQPTPDESLTIICCGDIIMPTLKQRFARTLFSMGLDLRRVTEDRRLLEQIILPAFAGDPRFRDILFVGCEWYNQHYHRLFPHANFWTLEIDPDKRCFGSRLHITDSMENLGLHFPPHSLDLIICNGVFGWGLNDPAAVEDAFQQCFLTLRPLGILLLGWNDIPERLPFPLSDCHALRRFTPWTFPPLRTSEHRTNTSNQHVYTFLSRLPTDSDPPAPHPSPPSLSPALSPC